MRDINITGAVLKQAPLIKTPKTGVKLLVSGLEVGPRSLSEEKHRVVLQQRLPPHLGEVSCLS